MLKFHFRSRSTGLSNSDPVNLQSLSRDMTYSTLFPNILDAYKNMNGRKLTLTTFYNNPWIRDGILRPQDEASPVGDELSVN